MDHSKVPPEDEFDAIFRESWFVPGAFVFMVAAVRGWRWAVRSIGGLTERLLHRPPQLALPPPVRALPVPQDLSPPM